jgi:hypothetical protein
MMNEIDNLREIARRCLAGEPLDHDQRRWLGSSLSDFLTQRCRTLHEAMGLCAPQGGVPWWQEEAMRKRDAALRELVVNFCPDDTVAAKAKRVHDQAVRYASSAWRFDRDTDEMPRNYTGTPREWLWQAFKSGATMPVSGRRLRSILSES